MNTLAKRLIYFRESHLKITQAEFCDRCNAIKQKSVSQQNISQWENNDGSPSRKKMDIILKAFPELNAGWLFNGGNEPMLLGPDRYILKNASNENVNSWADKEIAYLKEIIKNKDEIIEQLKKNKQTQRT